MAKRGRKGLTLIYKTTGGSRVTKGRKSGRRSSGARRSRKARM